MPVSIDLTRGPQRFVAFCLIAGLVFTFKYALLMTGGALYGRLTIPPPYDDVTYFVAALEQVDLFRQTGLASVFARLWEHPPHSPYSVVGAFFAFLLGGSNPAAPYAVNLIALTLIVATLSVAFRWSLAFGGAFFLFLTSLTWFDQVITVYHPDYVAGFGTAVVCAMLIWQHEVLTTSQRTALAGLATACALLTKPSAIAMSSILVATAFLLGALPARMGDGNWRRILNRLLLGGGVVAMVAGPYFVRQLPALYRYVHAGLVTERKTWLNPAVQHDFLFYAKVARDLFGFWLIVGLLSLAILGVVQLAAGKKLIAARYAGLLLVLAVAYVVPSLVEIKVPIFGSFFYGLVAVSLGIGLGDLHRLCTDLLIKRAGATVLILLALFSVLQFHDGQYRFPKVTSRDTVHLYDRVFAFTKDYAFEMREKSLARPITIYAPSPVTVAPHAFRYRGLLEGIDIAVSSSQHEDQLAPIIEKARGADILLVPDDTVLAAVYHYPVNDLMPAFRQWVSESGKFSTIDRVAWAEGYIVVYRAVTPTAVLNSKQK